MELGSGSYGNEGILCRGRDGGGIPFFYFYCLGGNEEMRVRMSRGGGGVGVGGNSFFGFGSTVSLRILCSLDKTMKPINPLQSFFVNHMLHELNLIIQ